MVKNSYEFKINNKYQEEFLGNYKSASPKDAVQKVFRRCLRVLNDDSIKLNIEIRNKATGKTYYYNCLAIKFKDPQRIEIAKGKFITIKYDTTILKLNHDTFF